MPTDADFELRQRLRRIATLGSVTALVGWDEQVMMPPGGTAFRADQTAMLAGMIHGQVTDPALGDLIADALDASAASPDSDAAAVAREAARTRGRAVKLPAALVEALSHTTVLAQSAWAEARKANDFAGFAPWLEKVTDLKRQEAACLGAGGKPYDALLDEYEPGETTDSLTTLFDAMRPRLVTLLARIQGSGRQAPTEILRREFDPVAQAALAREAAIAIGFDAAAGRLDVSTHPFCSGIAPGDTRITTRYAANDFAGGLLGTLHETGHAMYEQGLPKAEHFGTALGEAASLGVHESQSRLWENFVGRSDAFWRFFWPRTRSAFASLSDVRREDFLFALNAVRPSYIRTESDEVTYNLHVLLRFDIEQKLINGELAPRDVPAAWDALFATLFGIDVPDAASGCLQDVHWSCGLMGYFPTYTLGNMYAAQLFAAAGEALGDLDAHFARGEFAPLLQWLRNHVHC
ncbi:MAG TPA: carboxypeptidase M32, partial [Tepidisphaeraceae bacterium]